jgi:hypothetical protein
VWTLDALTAAARRRRITFSAQWFSLRPSFFRIV